MTVRKKRIIETIMNPRITFSIESDSKNQLVQIASLKNSDLSTLLREITDDYIKSQRVAEDEKIKQELTNQLTKQIKVCNEIEARLRQYNKHTLNQFEADIKSSHY